MFIIFTFVVPKMYPWEVRNDFNKDVYMCKLNINIRLQWNRVYHF